MEPSRSKSRLALSSAAAAAASLAPTTSAAPIIVTPGVPPTASRPFYWNGSAAITPIDLDGAAANDFNLRLGRLGFLLFTSTGAFEATASLQPLAGNAVLGPGGPVTRRSAGNSFLVGSPFQAGGNLLRKASFSFTSLSGSPFFQEGPWPGGANFGDTVGYAGVRFQISGADHYGWIKLSVQNDVNGVPLGVRALQWAYESVPGAPLHVTVPEVPASATGLGALALGATGIEALRRKRRKEAPAPAAD